MKRLFSKNNDDSNNSWMGFTDLMSGFLVVFIIISAVLFAHYNTKVAEANEAKDLAEGRNKELLGVLDELQKEKAISDKRAQELDSLKQLNDLRNMIESYRSVFVSDPNIDVEFASERGSIILTNHNKAYDLFDTDRDVVKDPLKSYLNKIGRNLVARTMQLKRERNLDIELRIEGHADPRGIGGRGSEKSFEENLKLSSRRANSVYAYICNNCGLDSYQKDFVLRHMISVGYSFSERIIAGNVNDTNEDAQSRRIEFRIISK